MKSHTTRLTVSILRHAGWLACGVAMSASAGIVQGVVRGVPPGTSLPLRAGEQTIGTIVVGNDGRYSVSLAAGEYVVRCPGGHDFTIRALNGPVAKDITC